MTTSQDTLKAVKVEDLLNYLDAHLKVNTFKDYCPNGLQVAGKTDIRHIVSGVTASQALLEAAHTQHADLILVHHGYFWRNENPCFTGIKRNRLAFHLKNEINLVAYHLPLDAHPTLGNNAQLGLVLGFDNIQYTTDNDLIAQTALGASMTLSQLGAHIHKKLNRAPLLLGDAEQRVKKIAWCTGAAQGLMEKAIALGVDVYISGEVSEQNMHLARESGVAYIAAGHHATERYGVQALGAHLASKFNISHSYIEIENPI